MKVFELAKELNIKSLDLVKETQSLKLNLKSHMSVLSDEGAQKIRDFYAEKSQSTKKVVKKRRKVVKKKTTKKKTVIRRSSKEEPVVESKEVETPPLTAEVVKDSVEAKAPVEAVVEKIKTVKAKVKSLLTTLEPEKIKVNNIIVEDSPVEQEKTPEDAESKPGIKKKVFSLLKISKEEKPVANNIVIEEAPKNVVDIQMQESDFTSVGAGETSGENFGEEEITVPGFKGGNFKSMEDFWKKKSMPGAPKPKGDNRSFRSTDFLRRERIYRNSKKRLTIKNYQSTVITEAADHKKIVRFDTDISVSKFAKQMGVKAKELNKKLLTLGVERPEDIYSPDDWILDLDTVSLIAEEYSFKVLDETPREEDIIRELKNITSLEVDESKLVDRAPVITVMGHIDHGKTSILDFIREARVTDGEAGGITQHIGAYTVNVDDAIANIKSKLKANSGKKTKAKAKGKTPTKKKSKSSTKKSSAKEFLTFLDTPGHAAFTEMRARGSKVTDIVILVVAANDGVMPQTREAVDHAKAAGVPIIVAVNKMDLPEANPDRVIQQLSEMELVSEEWGGDTIFCKVSALSGEGMDNLIEMIKVQSEVLELSAIGEGPARGSVVEAKLDKGSGPVATVLIQEGQLKVGDYLVAGIHSGKVRRMLDDQGNIVKLAGPSMPVELLGLGGVPEAGDYIDSVENEKAAKKLLELREGKIASAKAFGGLGATTADDIFSLMEQENLQSIPVILKADVKGTAEAIKASLEKIPQQKIRLKIISLAVGAINESDVLLASASNAHIFGFNIRPDAKARKAAEVKGVELRTFTIIYELIDSVTQLLTGFLAPEIKENVTGSAEVRNVFAVSKSGTIAGCSVVDGKIIRNSMARLIRDGRVIYTGKLSGLKRFKDDAKEVAEGYECGIAIENYNDIKVGDSIEAFTTEEIKVKLVDSDKKNPEAARA